MAGTQIVINDELKKQIEEAFYYRGHVTVTLRDGKTAVGYLFNRDYEVPKEAITRYDEFFIELFLKGSGDKARYAMKDLKSVAITGADEAAGKSYQDWMAKQEKKNASS
jgi:hypothetical protein